MVTATPHEDVEAAYGANPAFEAKLKSVRWMVDYLNGCDPHVGPSQALHAAIDDLLNVAQTDAYAEGRKDEAEDYPAGKLIDAWAAAHGKPVPWEKAVEIIAIVQKLPDAERLRLLALNEQEAA